MPMTSPNRADWLVVLPLLGCAFLACVCQAKPERIGITEIGFDRLDPSLVRQTTREILSDPRFSPYKTFWQWLSEKLSAWDLPKLAFASGWARVLSYILLAWCVLAVLVVLGHLIWSLVHLLADRFGGRRRGVGLRAADSRAQLTFEALREQADTFARQGAYRQAVGAMLVAVLCWLEDAGLLWRHESKTNGDYVHEFAGPASVQDEFRRLVYSVEPLTYGGAACEQEDYQHLNQAAERICSHVEQKPEI